MAKYKHLTMSENRNIFSVERRQKHSQDSESVKPRSHHLHQHIKVFRYPQHKFGRWGAVPTLYPADSFGAVSDSSGKVILVNATLFADFFDIVDNRHKNPL